MSLLENKTVFTASTIAEVKNIASVADPILRNLQITQCYYELSVAFAKRTGSGANWCTFATWASKQAGQTIKSEDLKRTLEALIKKESGVQEALSVIVSIARRSGATQSVEQLKHSGISVLLNEAAQRAGTAVSRGNKTVFEEIAYEFVRFITTCFNDVVYSQENFDHFCSGLREGGPPDGQDYLQKAFYNYYQSFFEGDEKQRSESCLLANLQIGFHEQTRLQPEIAEALNAAIGNAAQLKAKLLANLFSNSSFLTKSRLFFQQLFGRTDLLDKAADVLILRIQKHLRTVLTAHLMTMTIPPDNSLCLGRDLNMIYHEHLKQITNPVLHQLLAQVDPTPDSLLHSGATDWANLKERMHFIADLFRCYHLANEIFEEAFTSEQAADIKQGKIPAGSL